MSLLDQLCGAMDAADEYNRGKRARVEIILRHGLMVARAIDIAPDGAVAIQPRPIERMISLDMLELSKWTATGREVVDNAVQAL